MKPSDLKSVWRAVRLGLSWGLFALMAGLGVLVLAVPLATGSTPLAVLTGSMEPTLPPGTLVVVRPTAMEDISIGDVVTYQMQPDKPAVVSHRVVSIRATPSGESELITKGDNNNTADAKPVTAAQVRGTVWYSVPFAGYVTVALNGQLGQWLLPLAGIGLVGYALLTLLKWAALRIRKAREGVKPAVPSEAA